MTKFGSVTRIGREIFRSLSPNVIFISYILSVSYLSEYLAWISVLCLYIAEEG